ncbi:hypothetical protein SDC9_155896 [bioreactor metagenome]|uniref:Uncharacterized protein n=1 Tax=bioreactor metagenome TaxID=1076179 RepID=A0A645F524_9ZZZZ
MPFWNAVIRKLQRIEMLRKFFFNAFRQTVDVDISIIKRLHVIDSNIRKKCFSNFLCFVNHGFRRTHGILRIKRKQNNFCNSLIDQFLDSGFNAWFCVAHPDFHGNIYQFLKFFLNVFGDHNQRRTFIGPHGFVGFSRFCGSCPQNNSSDQKRTEKPAVIDDFFVH